MTNDIYGALRAGLGTPSWPYRKRATKQMMIRTTLRTAAVLAAACLALAGRSSAQELIRGADVSHLNRLEAHYVTFTDGGLEDDALTILNDHGVNWVRLRLWHTPATGYNNLPRTIAMAKRARDLGMDFLLDIHYSDTWADPGHQTKPAAWANLAFHVLVDSVRAYTEHVVASLKAAGATPQMVQIGNEIPSGMLWPDGRVGGSYDHQWPQLATLLNAGIEGVRAAAAEEDSVEIMIHIDRGGDASTSRWFFDNVIAHGVEFDVIGQSFYPWWHGTLDDLRANVNNLATRYDKDIVIVETAYPWTMGWGDNETNIVGLQEHLHAGFPASIDGQRRFIDSLYAIVEAAPEGRGRGIVYWEPTHIPAPGFGSPWENLALFNFDGALLESANALGGLPPAATELEITFRYVSGPADDFLRAFVPGEFNAWGNNSAGRIPVGDPSQMTFVDSLDQWIYTTTLEIGQTYQYKIHFHYDGSGSDWAWISDPLNDRTNPADNNNSVVTITDPMVFQPAREINADGLIDAVSAGVFSSRGIAALEVEVNGIHHDGLPHYDPASGILRIELDQPLLSGSQFKVIATDSLGRVATVEVGEIQPPVTWRTPDHASYQGEAEVIGSVTRQDGTPVPSPAYATLIDKGVERVVAITDGEVRAAIALERGVNEAVLRAVIDGTEFTSDTLRITRRDHPLKDSLATAVIGGSGRDFSINLMPAPGRTTNDYAPAHWAFDSTASTAGLEGPIIHQLDGTAISGTADGPGELYFDITLEALDGTSDFIRAAVVVEDDGTVRPMRYAETADWIERAVVYEIFPLSFGPTEAAGTEASPGTRFDEITAELDYIAQMGFTTLWFMPIFRNQFMDQLSGGYNITDFYQVDPKLGTNDDFKELVDRAHELGLRVILDVTPNHVSPVHPWVESVRLLSEDSPYFDHLQTQPSAHNRGLDGRGPNLPEVWQTEGGRELYRKYDGFGDLANVNWDDDDLQAEMLEIFAYWVREFDIDGWRFDVYWGPWRRYGPARFGTPIRELMRRIKPDAWLLGEIAGTGPGTEVYYAEDDHGTAVVGGIDAGYDWNFYHNAIRGTYGNLSAYDTYAHNADFWPGPNARYFRFLENHDETRIAKVLGSNPDRILPLAGFLLTTTGIPMIYQGQEVNFGNVGGDERRRPVSWETDRNGEFAATYQKLSHARTSFPAFGTQKLTTLSTSNSVYAYVRPYVDENAVVLINFAGDDRTVTVNPTPHVVMTTDGPIPYTHLFADSTFTDAELDGFRATLSAYETAVFITRDQVDFTVPDLPRLPFGAVYTGAGDPPSELPHHAALHQNYPNPFNPTTIIPYALPETGHVRLEVFDLLGRRVAVLIDGVQPAGRHEFLFDAQNLPSGTYVARLVASGTQQTIAIVLMR